MAEGIQASCEEQLQLKEIEFEKVKITEAEAEACTGMAMKDEHNKEIERENTKIVLKY